MAVKAVARLTEPNGRSFTKEAQGGTSAQAEAALAAELLITSGSLKSIRAISDVATAGVVTKSNDYSDATFHFRYGVRNFNVHFEQLSNSYAKFVNDSFGTPVASGYVDINNADIVNWSQLNYSGSDLISGKYVR